MIHDITREQYIDNPCGCSSVAYRKNKERGKPENIDVIHEKDYDGMADGSSVTRYFRLIHDLDSVISPPNNDFEIQTVNIETQTVIVAEILSKCYNAEYSAEYVDSLTKTGVFDNGLWIFAVERNTGLPVALGIADFDSDVKEGSLEWIQVLPEKRGQGLGKIIVSELLLRLKGKANFVTVSGQVDNSANPEILYRQCGFTGEDVWCVIRR